MKKFKWILYAVLIIAILTVTIPVVIGCGYTYLCEDDFSYEAGARDAAEIYGSSFAGAVHKVYNYAMVNQGTYTPTFLLHFIRAYYRWGFTGFHAVMIMNALFYILALFFLIRVLLKDKLSTLIVLLAACIASFNVFRTDGDKELFFWYTGALSYTLEIAFACIALAFCVLSKNETAIRRKRIYLFLSAAAGFIASGGALEVTALNCAWLLLMLVLYRKEVRTKRILLWPFAVSLLGALINVLAPGNYVRAREASSEGHITLADAIRDTFTCYHDETAFIFGSVLFVAVLAVVFTACMICKTTVFRNGISNTMILLLIPAVFMVQYLTMFPVTFGYHAASLIHMRTTGTYEITARFMYLFYVICLAQWCRAHIRVKAVPIAAAAVTVIAAFIISGNIEQDFTNGFSCEIMSDYCSGRMKNVFESRKSVMNDLEAADDGTDAVLNVSLRMDFKSMYGMGLTDDINSMCNRSAAGLFHLKSVSITYTDTK
jgi:hypothetical protein